MNGCRLKNIGSKVTSFHVDKSFMDILYGTIASLGITLLLSFSISST